VLITMFGVPTAAASVVVRIVRSLTHAVYGEYDFIAAASLEELRVAWTKLSKRSVVFYHESPSGEIISFFQRAAVPIVLFLDDPVDVALALHAERGVPLMDAARAASLCMSSLEALSLDPKVLTVNTSKQSSETLRCMIERLTNFLGITHAERHIEAIIGDLAAKDIGVGSIGADLPWTCMLKSDEQDPRSLEAGGLEALKICLQPYRCILEGRPVEYVNWPPSVFMSMDQNGRPAEGMFDLTGKRRIFFYGPYLGLPPGDWVANIEFEVANNEMGCVIQVNAIAKDFLTQGRIELPKSGRHHCLLPFRTVEPRWPVEIHFTLDHGVLQGEFGLIRVTIRRLFPDR
jgi:hypothetical protein